MALDTSRLQINFVASETVGARTFSPSFSLLKTFTDGTGALKAQKVGYATVSATSDGTSVALTGSASGTFSDAEGNPITFDNIKAIAFETTSANTSNILIGNASASAWNDPFNSAAIVTLPPSTGMAIFTSKATGLEVDTGDLLKVASVGANSDSVNIWALGEE